MPHMKSEMPSLVLEIEQEANRHLQPPSYAFILYALKRLCIKLFSVRHISTVMKIIPKNKDRNKPVPVIFE
jgi:hypothetical protein